MSFFIQDEDFNCFRWVLLTRLLFASNVFLCLEFYRRLRSSIELLVCEQLTDDYVKKKFWKHGGQMYGTLTFTNHRLLHVKCRQEHSDDLQKIIRVAQSSELVILNGIMSFLALLLLTNHRRYFSSLLRFMHI